MSNVKGLSGVECQMSNVRTRLYSLSLSLSLSFFVEDLVQGVRKQCRYGSSWAGTLGAFQPRAPGNRPDAITPPWTELGYPRLVRLRVRGPDARCICGRVVTAGASRSPLGRRSPPRFLGPLLPAGPLLRFYCVVTGTTRGSCSDPITVVEPVTPLWTALWTVDPPLPRRFGARIPAIALRDGR